MATAKKTQIVITANAAVAKKVMEELQQRIDGIKQKMAALDVTTKQGQREFKKLEKEMVSYNSAVTQNITNEERVKHAIDNLSKTSLKDLRRALVAAKSVLGKTFEDDPNLKKKQQDVRTLQAQIDKLTGSVHKHSGAWNTALKNLTAYVGLFSAFNMLKEKLSEIINLNFKFSDQLADIRKVSGWAMSDVNELAKRLAKIDTRNTIQQMNDLAYQGAKLGIGKYGVDGLTRFAEATAQIRMALHEDMGDESIAQLAKMAEVMHDMDNMGVSKALLASGSAIFKLSATTTSTGENIMEFSKRLLGLGRTADLTTPQILALGSAADTMALMPEVASTAFNKFITVLQSKYGQVAKAVGMNQERLKSLLDQHKTMDAIVEVLEHMRDMGDLNALAPIMGDLGSEGARLTNVFASMASNVQMLKDQLATSEEEFQKATAITAEFDIQNETSQALIERANNIWEKSFINSDNASGGIHDIAAAWYDMTKAITGSLSFMGEAGLLLKTITYLTQVFIGALPALINGLVYISAIKLTSWAQWPVIWGACVSATRKVGTALVNLVGIQTASQKSALATAYANQATAESMYASALAAKQLALEQQSLAFTPGEVEAANKALAAANKELTAAQEMLATSTVELSAITKTNTQELLLNSESKVQNSLVTSNLVKEDATLTTSKGMTTAMTNAEKAALDKETLAKEANAEATKIMRLAWGGILFISLVALIDKLYGGIKSLNAEEERNKEVTDKIANGLATANKELEDACSNLKTLYGELERNWNQMDERKRLMGEINSRYGEYIGNLVDENTKVGNLAQSYEDATGKLREYYFYKQKEALKADLVTEEQHKGDVSFMKLQNMGGKYGDNINLMLAKSAIKEYAKAGVSTSDIANNIFRDFYGESAPSNFYTDLSKLPLVGGIFPKNTFRSTSQEAMSYLHDFVKSYVIALNNEGVIEKNFPGEWTPPKRKNKTSHDNSGDGKGSATKPEDDARNNISEFITKIKNFYERQKTAMIEQMTKDNVEKEIQKQVVNDIDIQLKAALASAKQSIVLGKNTWNDFKKTMDKDRKEKDDEFGQSQSRMLLEQINAYDVSQLRSDLLKQMPKIKKGKVVGYKSDERDRAYLDRQWLDASKSEKDSASIIQERMEQRRKELLEHDYTKVVQENSFLGLINSRFADVSLESLQKDKNDVIKVLEKARKQIADVFETEGKKDNLLKFLFGENYENMPSVFLALLTDTEEDVKLFYQKLIQYSDEYVAAEKKQYDEAKKISDFMWKRNQRNLANQEALRKMQQESSLFGKRTNLLSNLGLADLTADPEVELLKLKMQMAEDYYAFCLKNSRNKQLIDEADKARQEAELAYANQMATAMKSRLSQMKELVQPIETFGAEVGKAFAQMETDVSSAQESIKNALKSMIESWANMALNDVNTQMWKAINDAGAKQGKKNAQPGIDAARANAKANATTVDVDWRNLGTADNPMWVRIVGGQYVDANGNPLSEGEPPAAWKKRNPDGTIHDYNKEAYGIDTSKPATSSNAAAMQGTATQAGTAIADAATGGTTLSDAVAGIGGSLVGDLMNTKFTLGGSSKKTGDDKEKAKQLKKEKKHQKELSKEVKKGAKDREKETHQGVKNITDITDTGNKEQSKSTEIAQNAITNMTQTALTTNLAAKEQNNQDVANSDAARTNQEVTFSIAGAMSKCFEFLGPIAGPIAAAGVMATLMGLLQWALNSAFSSSSKKSSSVSKNTKLVSGMLTYDSGNVQDLKPFVADNGDIYWATEDDGRQKTGVQMISTPRATTINGQPSLVAENGPEIVIGRETTHAMMMNNPALLKALVNYDSNYSGRRAARRAFDNGNVSELASAMSDAAAGLTAENGNLLLGASSANEIIANNTASQAALLQAVSTLIDRLNEPIHAKIDMYGRGNLYDSMNKANQFMKGKA